MEELSAAGGRERRGWGGQEPTPVGCSSRPGNTGSGTRKGGQGSHQPQVDSSPLFKGLLMSSQIRLDKGSRHLKVRAFWGS